MSPETQRLIDEITLHVWAIGTYILAADGLQRVCFRYVFN